MKKFIIMSIMVALCIPNAAHSAVRPVEKCVVYQCDDGYFADGAFVGYLTSYLGTGKTATFYSSCTQCPAPTRANGDAAVIRTWNLYVSYGGTKKSVPPQKPLLKSACYISPHDNQTFKDSTGCKYEINDGNCMY